MSQRVRSTNHIWLWLTAIFFIHTALTYASNTPPFAGKVRLSKLSHSRPINPIRSAQPGGPFTLTTTADPVITASTSAIELINSTQLPGSNPKSYTISASGLTFDLQITVAPPFVVTIPGIGNTLNSHTLSIPPVNGVVGPLEVSVALLSSTPGTFSGVITTSSPSAPSVSIQLSGTTVSPMLEVNPTVLNGFSTPVGVASSIQTYTITALSQTGGSVSAPSGVEIRTGNNAFASSLTIPNSLSPISLPVDVRLTGQTLGPVTGSISHRLFNSSNQSIANVQVNGTVTESVAPIITVSPSSLNIVDYSDYSGSFPTSYTVSASGLNSDLQITAPPYYLISAGGGFASSLSVPAVNGVVPLTTITVALVSSSSGTYNGTITNVSGSATASVAVSGTVVDQSVSLSTNSLSPFTTTLGTPSTIQSYTVTTRGGLQVSVSAPPGFEIRRGNEPFGSAFVIGTSQTFIDTKVDVRLTGKTVGPFSGSVIQETFYHSAHLVYPVAVSGVVSDGPGPVALSVSHRDADYGNRTNHIIKPYLQLNNEGNASIAYNRITVRYWFTSEGNSQPTDFQIYYAPLGPVKMKYVALSEPRQGAFGYVEYSFDTNNSLAPNSQSGPIENGILKKDRSNFNESDDYSYASATSYTKNSHITAYIDGALIWGQEPAAVPLSQQIKVYSAAKDSPVTSSISTTVELRNEGNVAVPLQELTVRYWFTSETSQPLNIYVDWAQLGAQNIDRKVVRLTTPVAGADSYAELGFKSNLPSLSPSSSTGDIVFRLVKPDFSLLNQTNDYSSGPVNKVENPRITVYRNGYLIYGTEPAGVGSGRLAAIEEPASLQATLLGNPITGSQATVEIRGAQGQPLRLQVFDSKGRELSAQLVEQAKDVEQQRLEVGQQGAGVYYIQVSTPGQVRNLKLLKP